MVNMRMEKALLDTEMTVVRNEFERGENNVQRVLEERVLATAYLWHNYGKSIIGSRADLERVPIDRLAAFYRKYYQPDNAVLVIAGQFDAVEGARDGGRHARRDSAPDARRSTRRTPSNRRRTASGSSSCAAWASTPVVMAAWHGPALAHPDSAALEVLAGVMVSGGGGRGGGAGTGRLYKALVDSKKALTVRMSVEELHDPGLRDGDRDARQRSVARRRAQDDDGHDRGRGGRSADRRRSRAREDAASCRAWKRGWPTRSRRRSA